MSDISIETDPRRIAAKQLRAYSIKEKQLDIYDTMYSFSEVEVMSGVFIVLPSGFAAMEEQFVKKKYPGSARPQVIISNDDTTLNFCFDFQDLDDGSSNDRMQKYKAVILKANPTYEFLENGYFTLDAFKGNESMSETKRVEVDDKNDGAETGNDVSTDNGAQNEESCITYYSYISIGYVEEIYNIAFFTDVDSQELWGWFNCPKRVGDAWKPLVLEMIQTIRIKNQAIHNSKGVD